MSARDKVAQEAPASGVDLSGFPTQKAPPFLMRAHGTAFGAWFFASAGEGRFDLTPPRGTCYASSHVAVAVRERFGKSLVGQRRVSADLADEFIVTELELPAQMRRSAAISALGADDYGVTGELDSMSPYAIPQRWAGAFDNAGFGSIRYRGRFSHTYGDGCWALFGNAGPAHLLTRSTLAGRDACTQAGITVMPPPPTTAALLRIITPPS